jgi:hypothetical protein
MTNNKKTDSDLPGILVGCGVFILGLIIVDCTYSGIGIMLHTWLKWPFIIFHIWILVLSIIVIAKISDPNYDKYRYALIAVTIAALLLVIAHRAGFVSDKMFQEDIKPKQENVN